jgi:hypothetical protein
LISIKGAILDGFGNVVGLDVIGFSEVSDSAGHLRDAVMDSCAKSKGISRFRLDQKPEKK